MSRVIEVVLQSVVEAVEGLEPAVGGSVAPVAEAQVPLAHDVSDVAQVLKGLRQDGLIVRKELTVSGHDDAMLPWSCPEIQRTEGISTVMMIIMNEWKFVNDA